jgi:hypothetical protein
LTYLEPETFTLIIFKICHNCHFYYYYYYYQYYHYFFVCLFVCLFVFRSCFCINMYFIQCLPAIYLSPSVVLVHNAITYMYTVLCL